MAYNSNYGRSWHHYDTLLGSGWGYGAELGYSGNVTFFVIVYFEDIRKSIQLVFQTVARDQMTRSVVESHFRT